MKNYMERFIIVVLLWTFFAQGMTFIHHASLTFDEGPHLAVGYTTLRTGDLRLQPVHIHPPLANIIAAAPLLLQSDIPDPSDSGGWQVNSLSAITDRLIWQYQNPAQIATAGRVPMLLLGFLTSAIIHRWAKKSGGQIAGYLALTLYAFDPNIIAHSSLITTDITVTLFTSATLFTLYTYLGPNRGQQKPILSMLFTGLFLGLAQLSKVSAILLLPVVSAFVFLKELILHKNLFTSFRKSAIFILIMTCTAFLVLWAGYGFELSSPEGLSFPLPAGTHIKIYQSLAQHYEFGHPSFAAGKISTQGWWWYFPLAFLFKTPIPTLLIFLSSSVLFISSLLSKQGEQSQIVRLQHGVAIGWLIIYGVSSLFSSVNIGYRHLLPLLPTLFVFAGQILSKTMNQLSSSAKREWMRSLSKYVSGILLMWLIMGTLGSAPFPLEYFNEFAGGVQGGYRYLVDSNVDWGQNLWQLKAWMDKTRTAEVRYAHYSPASPSQYGIKADFIPPDPRSISYTPWQPESGIYVLGATVLQGVYTPDINTYAYFRDRTPLVRLGGALFVYQIEDSTRPDWVVNCSTEPSAAIIRQSLSNASIRVINIDCVNAQVYPTHTGPGFYIVTPEQNVTTQAELEFKLYRDNGHVWRSIYRITSPPVAPLKSDGADFIQGPLKFLGHSLDDEDQSPGSEWELTTYWEVTDIPDRPISLLAHLVLPDGTALAVGDGMDFPIELWGVGDLLVQTHKLKLPDTLPQSTQVTVLTGGYWLDTMERWTTHHPDNVIVLREAIVSQ